jgi:hypothetical protein
MINYLCDQPIDTRLDLRDIIQRDRTAWERLSIPPLESHPYLIQI